MNKVQREYIVGVQCVHMNADDEEKVMWKHHIYTE
jgi:hypothetical protein